MATKLTPRMSELRAQLAEAVLLGLKDAQRRIDAGWPASDEDRQRLDENLAWWSQEPRP